ncbi:hypothetical protein QUA30_21100 [Microcoleus sp. Pol14C2]|uniref:hypothetical protein n=1 Tax=unclassified Microcoleus TaxID=2642155 RepID=UPI002FD42549
MKSPISKLLILLSCECNQNQQKTHLLSKLPFLGNRNLYRLALELQSVKHSLHQAGHYYCLDFSSIFSASTLLTISQSIKLILDMCTAPEGKSIFAWKTLKPELLLCNEVIGKRIGMPISNLKPCQIKPSVATNVDSKILTEKIPPTAILVIVEAPYTGQSLLAKGDKAPRCFHNVTINRNGNRKNFFSQFC